jgi:hypothetical protein
MGKDPPGSVPSCAMSLLPADRAVPTGLRTDELVLRPLTVDHAVVDHAALMASVEMLRTWSGTDWPEDDFTVADNREDLERHQREHRERTAFTYTVLDLAEEECLGCVYVTPLAKLAVANPGLVDETAAGAAVVRFWVTQPRLADGLDGRLLEALRTWFAEEWPLPATYFATREANVQQMELLAGAGLVRGDSAIVRAGRLALFTDG